MINDEKFIHAMIQEWVEREGDLQKAYQALHNELEQYGEENGASDLFEEKFDELEALIHMQKLLGLS